MRLHQWVILGSLGFVVAACLNSALLARKHLITQGPREVRSLIVRILLMVPVYGIASWLALVLRAGDFNKVLALFRKGCESVVVISFVLLLLAWLGGPEALAQRLDPGRCRHLPPLSFVLPSWAPAPRFVRRTLIGVLQNAICSCVGVTVIILAWCIGSKVPRAFEIAQPFCLILMNVSQFFAVYCVVTFYHANRRPLAPFRPVQKLLGIKGLVFCLFWQEAAIRVAERSGVFEMLSSLVAADHWTVSQLAWGLLNSVICVEMFILSLLHRQLYPPGEALRLRQIAETASNACVPQPAFDSLLNVGQGFDDSVMEKDFGAADMEVAGHSSQPSSLTSASMPSDASLSSPVDAASSPELSVAEAELEPMLPSLSRNTCESSWAPFEGSDNDPPLSGSEPGWQVWQRFLVALDLSDIPRWLQHLILTGAWPGGDHREAGQTNRELEGLTFGAGSLTVRNRSASMLIAESSRARMMVV
eukprot:TRINITY_DN37726_c0_g1_i1.p1 TRINITY_DN37726_c0_g1~~TRINITY_DN37726_c0_g1_i1.p1  ORF type:complete len:475 (-),score=64.78 TRINITY_DN37726_c0_g1_i1:133-1557(-)